MAFTDWLDLAFDTTRIDSYQNTDVFLDFHWRWVFQNSDHRTRLEVDGGVQSHVICLVCRVINEAR
jgi:hypothetical protein